MHANAADEAPHSRINGAARSDSPAKPSRQASVGTFLGNGAAGSVLRSCEVQERTSENVSDENKMLTWEVCAIIRYLLEESEDDETSCWAMPLMEPGSHWPVNTRECGGRAGTW